MAAHNDYGHSAEDRAAAYLTARGWLVLHRNWRWRHKELDVIVRQGNTVAFVEVRARASASYGHPAESISPRKRRDLTLAAQAWAARHGRPADAYRFDVVTILANEAPQHLEGAWTL
jgi:putative endonuclease